MDVVVEQLTDPTDQDIADILNLFRGVKGRTCTAAAYLEYLNYNWQKVAVFVVRNGKGIVGFTQAQAPSVLEPNCAWLPFSHATAECGHKNSLKAVALAEEWMKQRGATCWKMTTVRKPRAMQRLWGMRKSKEVLMEKEIADA